MKTKLTRPILVESKLRSDLVLHLDKSNNVEYVKGQTSVHGRTQHFACQELVLISLDPNEKIEVGDKYYDSHIDLILVATTQSDHNVYQYKKVIATQSQLSEEYIQRFVEEYNSGNVKDVEVEYYKNDYFGSKCEQYSPKLTNGFVTIVEKELIHFPYKIEKDKIILYGAGKFQEESLTLDRSKIAILFVELYKFLHFDKDPILYTEEEVEILCLKAMRDVLKHGHSLDTSNWFNQNKKQ